MNKGNVILIIILSALLLVCIVLFSFSERDAEAVTSPSTAETNTPIETVTVQASEHAKADEASLPLGEPDFGAASRVTVVNVSKADAIVVQTGEKNYLIDTGTKESAPALMGVLHRLGVERLDAVFLTHTHADHIGGFEAVAANLPIDKLYAATISENKKNGDNKITLLSEQTGVPLVRLNAGDAVEGFMVLGPIKENRDDDNDNSLVLKCMLDGVTYLFAGDMQFAEEETLLNAGADVSADVLKVGNHGNPDATSETFARAVGASLALISTDTLVDRDSANPRVIRALGNAKVCVSDDTPCGIVKETLANGAERLFALDTVKPMNAGVIVESCDVDAQTVTLRNNGEQIDISGWLLFSERGGELYRFPDGTVLKPSERIAVGGAGSGAAHCFAYDDSPWNKKKTDTAILYDANGVEMSRSS